MYLGNIVEYICNISSVLGEDVLDDPGEPHTQAAGAAQRRMLTSKQEIKLLRAVNIFFPGPDH